MKKEFRLAVMTGLCILSLPCFATSTLSRCNAPSAWINIHDGTLNYDFQCEDNNGHFYTGYGAYPGRGYSVYLYLYSGSVFNGQPFIAGPALVEAQPGNLDNLRVACAKMYSLHH